MFSNLNAELSRFKVSKEKLAELINVSTTTVYSKLNFGSFTCVEACIIRDYFNQKFGTSFTLDYLFALEPIAV